MTKINLKRTFTSVILAVGLLSVGLVSSSGAQGNRVAIAPSAKLPQKKKGCSNEALAGSYGFTGNGAFIAGNDDGVPAGPYTTVGFINFDGAGNFTVTYEVETFNGIFMNDPPFTGTYTVNSDCSLTITNEFGVHLAGIVMNGGNELDFISIDPGVVLNFVAKKSQ